MGGFGLTDFSSKCPQDLHQILLLLRCQLCAQDQIEEFDRVLQCQKSTVMHIRRRILHAAKREGFMASLRNGEFPGMRFW